MVICFDDTKELDVALAMNCLYFMRISFKIFRWRPDFNIKLDPGIVPVLVDIPYLKYEYLSLPILKAIGDDIGQFLAMDAVNTRDPTQKWK